MLQLNNMIDGKLIPSESGERIEVYNPFNQELVGTVPKSTKKDVDDALCSSKRAQNTSSKKRRIFVGNCRTHQQA